jgi:hypothetical protein
MEKVKDIMERLGFKDGATDSVKAAFIQNLIFQAYGVRVDLPDIYKDEETKKKEREQLSFNFEDVG